MTLLLLVGRPEPEKEKCLQTQGLQGPSPCSRSPWVPPLSSSSRVLGWRGLGERGV